MRLAADYATSDSLPAGWSSRVAGGDFAFADPSGAAHGEHPLRGFYDGALFLARGGFGELQRLAAARPPSGEERRAMESYFGVLASEDAYVREVAELALSCPLPEGWAEEVAPSGEPLYTCAPRALHMRPAAPRSPILRRPLGQ
jgi:hypothetical protein